jgi:hypothetical protein
MYWTLDDLATNIKLALICVEPKNMTEHAARIITLPDGRDVLAVIRTLACHEVIN